MPKVRRQRKAVTRRRSARVRSTEEGLAVSECSTSDSTAPALGVGGGAPELVAAVRKLFVGEIAARHGHRAHGDWMEKYMRNQFKFFGLRAPLLRILRTGFIESHKASLSDRSLVLALVTALWRETEREFQYFGHELLRHYRKKVVGKTEGEFDEALVCSERLIVEKSWWDTVDALAGVVGYFVLQRRERGGCLMQRWIAHDNMWLRRVAILHQNAFKSDTDSAMLFQFCILCAHEKEFFIRKAIGWALREYAKTDKAAVKSFVELNRKNLSPLSVREALKHY